MGPPWGGETGFLALHGTLTSALFACLCNGQAFLKGKVCFKKTFSKNVLARGKTRGGWGDTGWPGAGLRLIPGWLRSQPARRLP